MRHPLVIVVKLFILAFFVGTLGGLWHMAGASSDQMTDLIIENPFRISLKIETKCDWLHEKQRYRFYRVFMVPKKSNITISVPRNLRRCEIWPLDFKLL